ncbi:MAG: DNA mismatch repair protein MutS [bacterium]
MDKRTGESSSPESFEPSTPLMKQYFSIKEEYPDAILFIRLGDFYEMFGDDARIASKILQITLTTRDRGSDNPIPMCGVPHFAADTYITRLIREGHKVAVCEQVEDPESAKGIVKREVVRVVTPGTHEPEDPKENAYLAAIFPLNSVFGIAIAELSTGEFSVYETTGPLDDELSLIQPKEVLCPESLRGNIYYQEALNGIYVTYLDDWHFDFSEAYRTLLGYFKVTTLEGFGCESMPAGISAAGAVISYLQATRKDMLGFNKISTVNKSSFMVLDSTTQKNLELLSSLKDGTQNDSLLWVLDQTLTPMGGRFLRSAIIKPLKEVKGIQRRLDAVESLTDDFELIENSRYVLRNIHDIERLSVRLSTQKVNARDLVSIRNSIALFPKLKKILVPIKDDLLQTIAGGLSDFSELRDAIDRAIVDNPPFSPKDGGIIRKGFSNEIDELRSISTNSREYLSKLEAVERKKTGIGSLKISYNKIYGYYLEVTKPNLSLVPEHYIRKQTLVNAERFVTPELKEYESKIIGAEEKLKKLEYHLFEELVGSLAHHAEPLKKAASALALFDFLVSLATVARRHSYTKPSIDTSGKIEIIDGRHPVLERITQGERFVPNTSVIDTDRDFLLIITGPNMAGKSTYMRQTALIILLAQMGSFVPADSAHIGLVDRIFTRIGAADYLTKGQSTFMVEMVETANILNNATDRSFIILDEVGRGTSTFDGISIAWAVAEFIATQVRARTMFATHYNELTELTAVSEGVKNLNIVVREWGDEVIFLRKIENGPADKSYGIQVARLAGLPSFVLERAKEVLGSLEQKEMGEKSLAGTAARRVKKKVVQLDLFGMKANPLIAELQSIIPDSLTPEDAYRILLKLKELAEKS